MTDLRIQRNKAIRRAYIDLRQALTPQEAFERLSKSYSLQESTIKQIVFDRNYGQRINKV